MSLKIFPTLLLFLFTINSFAQEFSLDTLNRFNEKKKKTGYWIYFLDENTNPTSKKKAVYYVLEHYENGEPIIFISKNLSLRQKKYLVEQPEQNLMQGSPLKIDGTFEWKFIKRNGKTITLIEKYENGTFQYYFHSLMKPDSILLYKELADRTKKYKNKPYSYYYENFRHGKDSSVFRAYGTREKGQLKVFQILADADSLGEEVVEKHLFDSDEEWYYYTALLRNLDIPLIIENPLLAGLLEIELDYDTTGKIQSAAIIKTPHIDFVNALIKSANKIYRNTVLRYTEGKDTTVNVQVYFYCLNRNSIIGTGHKAIFQFCMDSRDYRTPEYKPNNFEDAKKYYAEENYEQALLSIDLAYRGDPTNPDVYFLMGEIKKAVGDFPGACSAFTKALKYKHPEAPKMMEECCQIKK